MSLLNRPHKYQLPPVLYAQITKWNRREVDDLTMADFLDDFFKSNDGSLPEEDADQCDQFLYDCLTNWSIQIGKTFYGRNLQLTPINEEHLRYYIRQTFERWFHKDWICMLTLFKYVNNFLSEVSSNRYMHHGDTLVEAIANPHSVIPPGSWPVKE